MNATSTASARLHLDTAIALVGREQVSAWLEATPTPAPATTSKTTIRRTVAATVAATPSGAGQRGRKAGALPSPDQRCSWTLTSGKQCSNQKKDGSFCGLHIGKIQLIDPTGAAGSGADGDDDADE